jgi:hypothetical protein
VFGYIGLALFNGNVVLIFVIFISVLRYRLFVYLNRATVDPLKLDSPSSIGPATQVRVRIVETRHLPAQPPPITRHERLMAFNGHMFE